MRPKCCTTRVVTPKAVVSAAVPVDRDVHHTSDGGAVAWV
jgi:hypothetical protein